MRKLNSKEAAAIFREAQRIWNYGLVASPRERRAALKKYVQAAESGNPEYQIVLGHILCNEVYSDTIESSFGDFKIGFNWILKAATQGDPGAQCAIARELAIGENVKRDSRAAASWYRKAARQGDAEAEYNLGMMIFAGEGVVKNMARARKWILRAAEHGEILAIMLLADAYVTRELGFPVDEKKAAYWRKKVDSVP